MRTLRLIFFCALVLSVSFRPPVQARHNALPFEFTDCPVELPEGETEGETIECGYFTVPEDYGDANSPSIYLAVAIIYSESDSPEPDPVLYLSGGPGDGAVSDVESWAEYPMRANRDIILLDQRGTGYSEPALYCSEAAEDLSDTEAAQDCHDQWVEAGVNLSAYNSAQSAADVAELRAALGYDEWNLVGISYGTRLALTIMRDYPEGIRSVILDSVYPPQINDWEEVSSDEVKSFDVLFAGCAADELCNDAYPDLENVFYETVDRLNREEAIYTATDPESGETSDETLTGDGLAEAIFQALYVTDNIPYLPAVIYSASEEDYAPLDDLNSGVILDNGRAHIPVWRQEIPSDGSANGMYNSVTCSEEVPFNDYDTAIADAESTPPELRDGLVASIESMFETCRIWDVTPADPIEAEPVFSDLPALVLAGEYDPATPPIWSEEAAQTLSSSFFFEFPGVGHAVIDGGDCPQSIIMAFLDDPVTEPDSSCIADLTGPAFVTQ